MVTNNRVFISFAVEDKWARDYLVSRLREIGWETQVQETTMAYPVSEGGNAAPEQWASSPPPSSKALWRTSQPSPPPASAKLRRGKEEERGMKSTTSIYEMGSSVS